MLTACEDFAPEPEAPPPLVRVLTVLASDLEGLGARLAPLLRVVTTGVDGATERAPLERVRAADDAGALERAGAPPEAPPGPPAPAPALCACWRR